MVNIDFLPERIRAQRHRRRCLVRQVWLLSFCLAALALLAYVREGTVAEAQADLSEVTQRGSQVRDQLELRNRLQREQADLAIKQRIEEQLGSRVSPRDILSELSRLMPKSMSLTRLSFEAMEIPVGPVSSSRRPSSGRPRTAAGRPSKQPMVKRVRLTIAGMAPSDIDVANFIGQLSACPLFENIDMGYTKTVEFRGREAREFQASCYVVR